MNEWIIAGCILLAYLFGFLIGERQLRKKFDMVPGEKYLTADSEEGSKSIKELDKKYDIMRCWVRTK